MTGRTPILLLSTIPLLVVGTMAALRGRAAPPPVLECPHYYSELIETSGSPGFVNPIAGDSAVPLSAEWRDVPEYNDCQRMVNGDAVSYGSLAAVFVARDIETLEQRVRAAGTQALAAATVYGIDGGYDTLGVRRGMNCLYMWQSAPDHWQARMVPVAGRGAACLQPIDRGSTAGTALEVERTPLPDIAGARLPAAARWEWNAKKHQVIGIRCGNAWCQVGPAGFDPTGPAAFTDADLTSLRDWLSSAPFRRFANNRLDLARLRLMTDVPGWSDEQDLGPAAGGGGPIGLRARVIPHPASDRTDDAVAFRNVWRITAFVWMPEPAGDAQQAALDAYTTKFGYRTGWNAIALCAGTQCRAPAGLECPAPDAAHGESMWFGRVDSPGAAPKYFCALRRGHRDPTHSPHVVGTARWRWRAADETTWSKCTAGCCTPP